MNIILAEEINFPLGSFIDQVKKKFPSSCVVNMNRNNTDEVLKTVKSPPPVHELWLVLASLRNPADDILNKLDNEHTVNVFVVRSKEELTEWSRKLSVLQIQFKIVNNLDVPKPDVVEYVMKELGVDYELAKYICGRHRYYLPKITSSVLTLKHLPKVTKATIRKYTSAYNDMSYDALFDYVIGVDERVSHNKAISLVHKYRYGVEYIVKFLVKRFEMYLYVYEEMMLGKLSFDNYKDYYAEHKSDMKDFSEYRMKMAIESFGKVSYDKLYYLSSLYKRELEQGVSVLSLLNLLRLSKV